MKLTETKISSRLIYDGKILKLYVDKVGLPDGGTASREIVRHSGGAAALLIREGKVALVKQFRYAYGKETYEIPAGKLERGEQPLPAAVRELREETGYFAQAKEFLKIYPSPGYTDEIIYVFIAENAEFVGQKTDGDEFLNIEFIPLPEVVKMIESGEICDAKTVAAVYKYIAENKNQ